MDNILISDILGAEDLENGLQKLMPGFQILGRDYTGWTDSTPQQFNFKISDVETALGRSIVNGEQIVVYILE